ncbi:auxin-responsive protein SAUR71-like [Telopea speciosissima]|uniref:auxin-responsive protein SAUR71-like n=1 Tax=Telopea speciosissima TaxID=54955 RepID=UPI001CC37E1E|nr:auxin-responsive protein SAUR71-like [Telopea speciosissima]
MEVVEQNKGRKNLISKTWELCRSMSSRPRRNKLSLPFMLKSRSWPRRGNRPPMNSPDKSSFSTRSSSSKRSGNTRSQQVAPEGCFAVYVGPQRQRFVMKMKYANHPLFKMLLEEAEEKYGYNSQGPLALPNCDVDQFYEVLSEMNCGDAGEVRQGCSFVKRSGSYHLLSPSRMLAVSDF